MDSSPHCEGATKEMSLRIRAIIALVLVVCILLPATAYPLKYAPGSIKNGILEGHPEPPVTVAISQSRKGVYSYLYWSAVPIFGMRIGIAWTSHGFAVIRF